LCRAAGSAPDPAVLRDVYRRYPYDGGEHSAQPGQYPRQRAQCHGEQDQAVGGDGRHAQQAGPLHASGGLVLLASRTGVRQGASGVAVSLVCADEAPQLAAIEALIGQTLRREEEPGFEAEHRVPETSSTGQLIKKPKKPKKPKVPQGGAAAMPVAGKKPRPQG